MFVIYNLINHQIVLIFTVYNTYSIPIFINQFRLQKNRHYFLLNQLYTLLKSGANGFIEKGCNEKTYWDAIETVKNGKSYFSDSILEKLKMVEKSIAEKDNGVRISIEKIKSPKDFGLSEIEIHILKLICDKETYNQIADIVCKSKKSVEYHIGLMLRKTGLKDRHELRDFALQNNWHKNGDFNHTK